MLLVYRSPRPRPNVGGDLIRCREITMRSALHLPWLLALAGIVAGPVISGNTDPPKPEIVALEVSQEGGQLVISFRLENAYQHFAQERVESGLPTRFEYEIRLVRNRKMWFDQKLKKRLEVEARYNAATMDYRVNYRLQDKLVDTRVVRDPKELARAMTEIHELPVFQLDNPLAGERPVALRVRGDLGSKTILWLIPDSITTDWTSTEKIRLER
jgi:hypothetical protein